MTFIYVLLKKVIELNINEKTYAHLFEIYN